MDRDTRISFIPKKPLIAKKSTDGRRPVSLFVSLSSILWIIVFSVYAGLYFYRISLDKTVEAKTVQLEEEKRALESTAVIARAHRIEQDIGNMKFVLEKHVLFTPVLEFLQKITLESVQFTSIAFSGMGSGTASNGSSAAQDVKVALKGTALDFSSLAYQLDVLKKQHDVMKSFSLKNFSLDDFGNVNFELEILLSPSYLLYTNKFNNTKQAGDGQSLSASTTETVKPSDNVE